MDRQSEKRNNEAKALGVGIGSVAIGAYIGIARSKKHIPRKQEALFIIACVGFRHFITLLNVHYIHPSNVSLANTTLYDTFVRHFV